MVRLHNSYLELKISNIGAEIKSFLNVQKQTEIILQQGNGFWDNSCPILFPFIGQCYQNQYQYCGSVYPMPKHGFARQMQFELISSSATLAVFSLMQNEKTLELYPFNFNLTVSYILQEKQCVIRFSVTNPGPANLPFQLGYHPAFRFNINDLEKCHILFDHPETQIPYLTNPQCFELTNIPKQGKSTYSMIYPHSDSLSLTTPEYRIKVYIKGFLRLALWRKTPDTPFICIEPQIGGGDANDVILDIFERNNCIILKKGQQFTIESTIEFE